MTRPIIEWLWSIGKSVIIPPRVKKGSPILELCLIDSFDDMDLSPLGILEPKPDHIPFCHQIKLILYLCQVLHLRIQVQD